MYVQVVAGDSNIYADAVPNLFKSIIYINWVFGRSALAPLCKAPKLVQAGQQPCGQLPLISATGLMEREGGFDEETTS